MHIASMIFPELIKDILGLTRRGILCGNENVCKNWNRDLMSKSEECMSMPKSDYG